MIQLIYQIRKLKHFFPFFYVMEMSQRSADLTNKHFFNFLLRIFMEIISIINNQTMPSDKSCYCNEVSISHWKKLQSKFLIVSNCN